MASHQRQSLLSADMQASGLTENYLNETQNSPVNLAGLGAGAHRMNRKGSTSATSSSSHQSNRSRESLIGTGPSVESSNGYSYQPRPTRQAPSPNPMNNPHSYSNPYHYSSGPESQSQSSPMYAQRSARSGPSPTNGLGPRPSFDGRSSSDRPISRPSLDLRTASDLIPSSSTATPGLNMNVNFSGRQIGHRPSPSHDQTSFQIPAVIDQGKGYQSLHSTPVMNPYNGDSAFSPAGSSSSRMPQHPTAPYRQEGSGPLPRMHMEGSGAKTSRDPALYLNGLRAPPARSATDPSGQPSPPIVKPTGDAMRKRSATTSAVTPMDDPYGGIVTDTDESPSKSIPPTDAPAPSTAVMGTGSPLRTSAYKPSDEDALLTGVQKLGMTQQSSSQSIRPGNSPETSSAPSRSGEQDPYSTDNSNYARPRQQLRELASIPSRQASTHFKDDLGFAQMGMTNKSPLNTPTTANPSASTPWDPSHSRQISSYRDEKPATQSASRSTATGSASPISSASPCGSCRKPVKGQFVRAMGKVFHLDCFRCKDCGVIVASKFFPVDDADGSYPLCERDYFARLDLICGKCDKALRGSYITACGKKFHVEHFTCSVCDTVFGPQDSYYEHDSNVFKCVGCANAILKQFVEINRNQRDECWHPECYMIHKFWNVKLTSKFKATPVTSAASSVYDQSLIDDESKETPESLKAKQHRMETQVEHIWRVLSAFEESSAACISEMLRFVSATQYLEAVIMAEHFILHVEVLFAAIDDLEAQFAMENAKGMSHVREARMLCRKTVNFFSLLAHTQDDQQEKAAVTQELLALVTGLAHYLKILIRIALTGSLKLEREFGNDRALDYLLERLALLAKDDTISTSKRVLAEPPSRRRKNSATQTAPGFTPSTREVAYGYASLSVEVVGQSVLKGRPPPHRGLDHCVRCDKAVDEGCIRLGLFQRWHPGCLQCDRCGKAPQQMLPADATKSDSKPIVRVDSSILKAFGYTPGPTSNGNDIEVAETFCDRHVQPSCSHGFEAVSRLEQYAYLLNIALRRLYDHLKDQGVVPESPPPSIAANDTRTSFYDAYRDSGEIKRLKSVNLDRKFSANARTPQRSTVVESPAGKSAKTADNSLMKTIHASAEGPSALVIETSEAGGPRSTSALSASSSHHASPGSDVGPTGTDSTVLRPSFARNNTHIRIVDDTGADGGPWRATTAPGQQSISPAFAGEDGVTLADIPQLVEAEQARMEHRQTPAPDGRPLLSELNAVEATTIKHFALYSLSRSPIGHLVDIDDLLDLMDVRKNVWWNKLFKAPKDKKDVKRKGVFGVPLEILVEKTGSDSQLGHSNYLLRVPEFIDNVVSAMKQMDMSVEGIFRKNGNIKRLNQVAEALDRDPASVNLVDDNPVQLAALLKKFLRDLPEPLMTFKLHKLFCAAQSLPREETRLRCLHLLICLLPRVNRDTVEVLFVFLKWVASFSHIDEETGSKMDIQNLATVISGSILYSKGHALQDDSFVSIAAIATLIEHQDQFYSVPMEIEYALKDGFPNILASHLDSSTPKSIYQACTTYILKRGAEAFDRPLIAPGALSGNPSRAPGVSGDIQIPETTVHAPIPMPSNGQPLTAGTRMPITTPISRPSSWSQNHPINNHGSGAGIPGGSPSKPSMLDHISSAAAGRSSTPSSPIVFDSQLQQQQQLLPKRSHDRMK